MPRYLMMIRINESEIPPGAPGPEVMERMGRLMDEMKEKGVLLETAGLKPTSEGTRLNWYSGRLSATDGPFTETKEVVGGYAILRTENTDQGLEWAKRFLELHGDELSLSAEIREIAEG